MVYVFVAPKHDVAISSRFAYIKLWLFLYFKNIFFNIIFIFSDHFDTLILKIIYKK